MKAIIDRFEGNYAVLELQNKQMANIDKKLIPGEAKEGDALTIIIEIDSEETEKRHKRISGLMKDLFKD